MSPGERVRFLIMQHLPAGGRHVMLPELKQNVHADALDLRVDYSNVTFDNALGALIEDQYVVNLGGRIIATNMGLLRSNLM